MKRFLKQLSIVVILGTALVACNSEEEKYITPFKGSASQWVHYQGGPDRNQYSTLEQINPSNVNQLELAWQFHTKDTGQVQTNPLMVNGMVFGMTATTQPFAVDAATGKLIWRKKSEGMDSYSTSRGLSYWEDGKDQRILYTSGSWLYAVESATGEPIEEFGEGGRVSLKKGLGEVSQERMVISNTPGTIYKDIIVMPLRVSEGADAALGLIQAFNIRTGELEWVFNTIPGPEEFGHETWPPDVGTNKLIGGANNWAGMAVDIDRGIIYAPTGSAAFDFYGGNRQGENLFANSLIALDAETGKRLWHFQFVHHDILDRDLPAPPNLMRVTHNGKKIDAVAQTTKQGFVFVFDRVTGEPLFPIEERSVPGSDIPGESAWPTQPFPTKPKPYARQTLTEEDISPLASNRDELIEVFRNSRYEGPFTPLSEQGTIIFPGLDGGAEWGGAAADPQGILYVNSNEMAWRISLNPTVTEEELAGQSHGQRLYTMNCVMCHGEDRTGSPASGFPSLVDIESRRDKKQIRSIIEHGQGMMPAFNKFSEEEMDALIAYVNQEEIAEPMSKEPGMGKSKENDQIPYQISGYDKFLDADGYPAVRPPWGTLNAIDLNTGEYLWTIPYGEHKELMEKGIPQTGSENYGGPVVTASGLLFIAGTKDAKFRAYNKNTGELLWETELPSAAFSTPSIYEIDGRQYVVVACGGTKLGAPGGDSYVAFALPKDLIAEENPEKN
ncbi:PQQ-binding-like beta-propeller repeat protein [Salegentibacter mishustinae]|uniref:outer membrane protein assembly factor BamB family protein n=1 Tax=Salegentibacter mishustinae TaxID=270918 RepID=UPI001CE0C08F|nr:PQQ-binding-like beta-propeller repeat protein [Salegentibacter mishustinae]UBZ05584.1 PQQ-binding-like beta-propeller repeat protein [Salegentibacter mishustinae]